MEAKQRRRQFKQELKREAVRLVLAGDTRLNQVARELGVRPETLRQWRRQLRRIRRGQRGTQSPDPGSSPGKLPS